MKKIILLFIATAVSTYLFTQTWTNDYTPGNIDLNGQLTGGNEIMQIVTHKAKLFAGNSYWQENDTINNPRSCEIIRKDNPNSAWQVDKDFTTANLRIGAMKSFIFNTDFTGATITPDTLLITIPNDNTGQVNCWVRNDNINSWNFNTLATIPTTVNCRSLGFHKDATNNICYVFAGLLDYGIFRGSYNSSLPTKIQWTLTPEFVTPLNKRVMGFTVCNNILYAATSDGGIGHIYKRSDATASWSLVKTTTGGVQAEDIRGLSAIPNPNGAGEVLWYSWNKKASRLDPNNNYTETIEYSYTDSLTSQLGIQVQYTIAAYNDNIPVFNPTNANEDIRLIGIELKYNASALLNDPRPNWNGWGIDGQYYERHQSGSYIYYVRKYILNNSPIVTDTLIATRTICVSPFENDNGKVLYAGGMDCNSIPMSRQAWIYTADFNGTTTTIKTFSENNTLLVFPNPATSELKILLPSSNNFIAEIINSFGETVLKFQNQTKIDVSQIARGIYFLKVNDNKNIYTQKIIIQ
jgi:hypothetical protein